MAYAFLTGARSHGPLAKRGLCSWLVRKDGDNYVLDVIPADPGTDGRGLLGTGSLRLLTDIGASRVASKYEDTANAIWDLVETQAVRERTIDEVRQAISRVDDSQFIENKWFYVEEALRTIHPVNPSLADAETSLAHLGTLQTHLTTYKRRRVNRQNNESSAIEETPFVVNEYVDMHIHSRRVLIDHFLGSGSHIASCLVETCESELYSVNNEVCCITDPENFGITLPHGYTDFLVGLASGSRYFVKNKDPLTVHKAFDPRDEAIDVGARDHVVSETLRSEFMLPSCHKTLIEPAIAATNMHSGIFEKSAGAIEQFLLRPNGFASSDAAANQFAKKVVKELALLCETTPVFHLIPDSTAEHHDAVLDFDNIEQWTLGTAVSDSASCVEACQSYVSTFLS